MRETWIWSLGWEDPLEKGKATHSSILAWRIPWTVQSMGLQRVWHDWATFTTTTTRLQHTRPPCPSPTPGALPNSCPSSRWCRPIISSSVFPFSCLPSNKVFSSESVLHIRWPKYWSFSFSISPSNEYWGLTSFRMDWVDLPVVQGTLKSLPPTSQFKSIDSSPLSFPYGPTLTSIHDYCKNQSFDSMDLCCQIMSLLFNALSRFVKGFLSRTKCLSIPWLHSPSAVILEPKNINSVTVSIVSLPICHDVMGLDAIIFVFQMLSFKPAFSLSYFTFIKRLLSSSSLW